MLDIKKKPYRKAFALLQRLFLVRLSYIIVCGSLWDIQKLVVIWELGHCSERQGALDVTSRPNGYKNSYNYM